MCEHVSKCHLLSTTNIFAMIGVIFKMTNVDKMLELLILKAGPNTVCVTQL